MTERVQKQAHTLSEMIELGWGQEAGAFREVFANLLMPDATKEQLRWIGELRRYYYLDTKSDLKSLPNFNALNMRFSVWAARMTGSGCVLIGH